MDKSITIILAAAFGFISIVADQITYQTEKQITISQDEVDNLDDRLIQNLNYWNSNIQRHKDIYFDLNNANLEVNMSAIAQEHGMLKGRHQINPDSEIGKLLLKSRPHPFLTKEDKEKIAKEYVDELRKIERVLNLELQRLVMKCANYLFETFNCLEIQKNYFSQKSSIEKMSLIDANDKKIKLVDEINNAYFDDYLSFFISIKEQKSKIAFLNFRRQLLIIVSVIFNMIAIISLLLFFRQSISDPKKAELKA